MQLQAGSSGSKALKQPPGNIRTGPNLKFSQAYLIHNMCPAAVYTTGPSLGFLSIFMRVNSPDRREYVMLADGALHGRKGSDAARDSHKVGFGRQAKAFRHLTNINIQKRRRRRRERERETGVT